MEFWELILVAVGLSMDAFAIAICKGLSVEKIEKKHLIITGLWFGGAQAAMPLLGYLGGEVLRSIVSTWAPWVVLAVFGMLGGSIIFKAWREEGEEAASASPLGLVGLLMVGVATSVDALAVGACMALGEIGGPQLRPGLAAGIIGLITFICAMGAFHSARLLHHLPTRWLETLAGLLLIALGVQNIL